MKHTVRIVLLLIIATFIILIGSAEQISSEAQAASNFNIPSAPASPADVPEVFISNGAASLYADASDVFWISGEFCYSEFSVGCRLRRAAVGGDGTYYHTLYQNPSNTSADDLVSNITVFYSYSAYWASGGGDILGVNRYAYYATPDTISTKENASSTSEVAVDHSYVYWTENVDLSGINSDTGKLFRALRSGGTRQLMDSITRSTMRGLMADGDYGAVFIADDCNVFCIPDVLHHIYPNGGVFRDDTGETASVEAFTTDGTNVYWATSLGGTLVIKKAPIDDLSATTTFHTIGNPATYEVTAMTIDQNRLFWHQKSGADGPIYRMYLDGTDVTPITPNIANLKDLTSNNRFLYWIDAENIIRLEVDAAASQYDVSIDDIEVTQGIQTLDNTIPPANSFVPLVQEKWTMVRVYPALDESSIPQTSATVRLYGTRNSNPLPGSPLVATYVPVTTVDWDRAVFTETANFVLPSSWLQGDVTLEAEIVANALHDPDLGNNSQTKAISFVSKANICIKFVPIATTSGLTYRTRSPLSGALNTDFLWIKNRFHSMWPVADIRWYTQYLPLMKPQFLGIPRPFNMVGGADKDFVMGALWEHNIWDNAPGWCTDGNARTHYVAMVHPAINTTSMTSSGTFTTLLGFASYGEGNSLVKMVTGGAEPFFAPQAGAIMAQELAHNNNDLLGASNRWKHVNCGLAAGAAFHPSYPYPTNQIGPAGQRTYWGFDRLTNTPIDPTDAADYMSYCSPSWTSDYSYRGIMDQLSNPSLVTTAGAQSPQITTSEALLVAGEVALDESSADFFSINRLPASIVLSTQNAGFIPHHEGPEVTGSYFIELLSGSDSVLVSLQITPTLGSDGGNFIFTADMAFDSGATSLRLRREGVELVRAAFSPNVPVVSILTPEVGDTVSAPLTVQWMANDTDGDPLTFAVQYSADNGNTWNAVVTNYADTTLVLTETWDLAGSSNALIRVIANDGVNNGMATSDPFILEGHDPLVWIDIPLDGAVFSTNQTVVLEGGALDPEDGPRIGSSLNWDVTGPVTRSGVGTQLILNDLAPGIYTAKLTASDKVQNSAFTTSTFTVKKQVIFSGEPPVVDGFCDDPAYAADLNPILLRYPSGAAAIARFLHTDLGLFLCVSDLSLHINDPEEFLRLYFDPDASGDPQLQFDDLIFQTSRVGQAKTGSGDQSGQVVFDSLPDGLLIGVSAYADTWQAELWIDNDQLGGWNKPVGFRLLHDWSFSSGDEGVWPVGSDGGSPQTWGGTIFGKVAQSIDFSALADRKIDQSPFNVQATASSGLMVSLTSNTPSVCLVSGKIVTLFKGGRCSLTAAQPGGDGYLPANSVTREFDVIPIWYTLFLPLLSR